MKLKKINKIAKGWSSYIWLAESNLGEKVIIKEVREKSPRKDLAEREGKMLLLANSMGVGPKVIEVNFEKNFVVMEYIDGIKLLDWVTGENFEKEVSRTELWKFLKLLYKQLYALNSINLSHNQLQVGKNILVKKIISKETGETIYSPVIIDFEKASIKENKTRNIGQIESFLFYNPHSIVAKKIRQKLNATL